MPRAEKSTMELKKDLDKIRERYERSLEKDNRKIADLVRKYFGDEPDHSEETVFGKLKSGLFRNLTLYAVIGRLAGLTLSSYADPLSGIGVVFLFISV